jgi:uncharacterized membrane protein
MQDELSRSRKCYPTWLQVLFLILITIGVLFRFTNLDKKLYSGDESFTSLWIAGYRVSEVKKEIFDGSEIGVEELQKYQHINREKGLIHTVIALAIDDPKNPPLYYVLTRLWAQIWGDSVGAIRSFSAIISLLGFLGFYWLCRELFASTLTAWMAVVLVAVSPFHVLYAQEARPYSLWTLTILLSSAALLRAIRLETKISWRMYAATVGLGLYTHGLFCLIAMAHGAYVAGSNLRTITLKESRLPKAVRNYLFAALAGIIAFAPWAAIIIFRLPHLVFNTAWVTEKAASLYLLERWVLGLSSLSFDMNYDLGSPLTYFLRLAFVLLAGYSIYFLCSTTARSIWLFVLTLVGTTVMAMVLPDVVLGGRSSAVPRFLVPFYIGVQLSIAYLLVTQIGSPNRLRSMMWKTVAALLILGGILSCAISSEAEIWWNKGFSSKNIQVARLINQSRQPLVISNSYGMNLGNIISLSYLLAPKARFRLVNEPGLPVISDGFSDVFLFDPAKSLAQTLTEDEKYGIEAVYPGMLWRLKQYSQPVL